MLEKNQLPQEVITVQPRGQCAGVIRAINHLRQRAREAQECGKTLYCVNEIVHNKRIVKSFKQQGVIFITPQQLDQLPPGTPIVFSAHGVSPDVVKRAQQKDLDYSNAICPLVEKIHNEATAAVSKGRKIIYIGKPGHEEAEGVLGIAPANTFLIHSVEQAENITLPQEIEAVRLNQTTLSQDQTGLIDQALRQRFSNIRFTKDLCYATQNRQLAIKALIKEGVDGVYIIGSSNSHNSKMLAEVAKNELEQLGKSAVHVYRIDGVNDITPNMFESVNRLGISSGASADEEFVEEVINLFVFKGSQHNELIIPSLMIKERQMDKMVNVPIQRGYSI